MRDCIAWLLGLFLPARGKRRAEGVPTPTPTPTPEPAPYVRPYDAPLRGEDVALVRPYLIAWEQGRERALQRERRTAATLATMGIDFVGGAA